MATAVTKAVARSEVATASGTCRHTAMAISPTYGSKAGVAAAAKSGVATPAAKSGVATAAAAAEVAVADVVVAMAVVAKLPATMTFTTQMQDRHPIFQLPTRR